jgi:hypothetical protein
VIRLPFVTWIGNAAAKLCGNQGAITAQAQQVSCSRQTVYDHADKVQQAVADAHLPGPSRQQLLEDNRRLSDENRQLCDGLEQTLDGSQQQRQRFATTATAMGLSLQQILVLLAILVPAPVLPSRATLGRWVRHGAHRSQRLLRVLDHACRSVVVCLCLEEIFFHRQPVLMGIEPHSMAWVLGQRAADRSGPTWAKALADWPQLAEVAADGGSGIELGLRLAAAKRQEDAAKVKDATGAKQSAVPLRIRLDVFHTRREGERALRLEWAQAERQWAEADQADRAKARFDRRVQDGRHFNKSVPAQAGAAAIAAYKEAERKETAWRRAVAALEVFRPDGRLNDRTWAQAQIRTAVAELTGTRWAKVCRMLLDERTLTFLDCLHEELTAVEPGSQRREALVALWHGRRQQRASRATAAAGHSDVIEAMLLVVVTRLLGEQWEESYRRVSRVLRRVVRASSAVECVNSVVRMHQARHRKLSQELLDLKRLYWNCRSFVGGQRRGRCPYQHLGLKLPTYDAWELLQMAPEELAQNLSSSKLAA